MAHRQLGHTSVREDSMNFASQMGYQARALGWLDSLQQDLRYALRLLWRAKAFTGAAVLTLALGIAGTTVMFALIQGVLLRPLPVHDQNRLILAWKEVRTSESARYPFGNTAI